MKILFLTDNFPPEVNAAATRVYERACYWVKNGHEVTILTCAPNFPKGKVFEGYKNKWYQEEIMNGIRVIRVKTFISSNEGFMLRTLDFISFMMSAIFFGIFIKKHDVVMITSPQFFTAIAGWILSVIHRRPFVFEVGDLWPESIKGVGFLSDSFIYRFLEKIELFLYKKAAAIVCLTSSFKINLQQRGINSEKIHVVLNAVDLTLYHPQDKNVNLLQETEILKEKFVIGYTGTHGMAHDLINILYAAEILQKDTSVHFLFVGEGAEKEKLVSYAQKQQLSNVHFFPLQPKKKIPAFWSICDIAIIHLKDDKIFKKVIPSKMFEAMAMGLPLLVVSPGGESKELVEKNKCGLFIYSGKSQLLADTIIKLKQDPDMMAKFKQASYQASKLYSRETQAENVIKILNSITKHL
ncbi:MAG: glycosyltransferase family 4 protein [Janthinobacterium lividum]